MFVLTSGQMRLAEEACVEREGITFTELMERAGTQCAKELEKLKLDGFLIVCGKGKNGGDGFVIARKLVESGHKVTVLLACGEPKAEDAVLNFERLDKSRITAAVYNGDIGALSPLFEGCEAVVDCIFGTGFSGRLDERLSALVEKLNSLPAKRIAIDVPTGIDCDTAKPDGTAFSADLTIAISALKPIHITKPASVICGKTVTVSIGITPAEHKASGSDMISLSADEARALLPERPPVSNKGTYGHVLSICGSMRMQGAAVFAATGALRMGAGLVTAAFPEKAYPAVAAKLTEPLMLPLPCDDNGFFTAAALPELFKAAKKATAVLIGCGIGTAPQTVSAVHTLISELDRPLVIDADGINCLAKNIDILKAAKRQCVLTPHPGEMSRLTGKSIAEILADPVRSALSFANEFGVTLVLKTANTVICSPGCPVCINCTGNTALSKGGSGDLLAGMIAALLANGVDAYNAARAAVFFHGRLADLSAGSIEAQRAVLPSDLAAKDAFILALSER